MKLAAVLFWLLLLMPPAFAADHGELRDYQNAWCTKEQGALYHVLDEKARVDCMTDEHAVVFTFGPQWAEAVGQAITYAARSGKKPGVVLIMDAEGGSYLERLTAEAQKYSLKVWTMKPEDLHRAETGMRVAPIVPAQLNESEFYVALFGGDAKFADATRTVTARTIPFLCVLFCPPPVTVSKKVTHGRGFAAGLRVGIWGGNEFEYLGFALEMSDTKAPAMNDAQESHYSSFVLLPMLRIPLFKTESMPRGRFDLYGGLGFSREDGIISLNDPALPHAVSVDGKGNGSVALIGASLRFSRLSIFVEHRTTAASLSFDEGIDSGEVEYNTKQTIFGLAYRF